MHPLEIFFWQKVNAFDYHTRFKTLLELEDVLVVNFDCQFERDYGIRGMDQLIYQLHKRGQDKRFLFLSEDGANLQLSGAVEVIKNIVNCFNLNADTCAVICRETLEIPNVTVINKESIPHWCGLLYPTIKNIDIPQGPFSKKFAIWFHRGTFYRLLITKHLKEYYPNDSFISYQESGMLCDWQLKNYFTDEITWADANTPIVYDQLFPKRVYDHEMIVGDSRKPYNDYFLEIIVETDCISTSWITEKTIKNLYIGKPFIVMSGAGTLEKIRSFGFKTFSPWIDESYDSITNNYKRFEAIKHEIDKISQLSHIEIQQLNNELKSTVEYNRQQYMQIVANELKYTGLSGKYRPK